MYLSWAATKIIAILKRTLMKKLNQIDLRGNRNTHSRKTRAYACMLNLALKIHF